MYLNGIFTKKCTMLQKLTVSLKKSIPTKSVNRGFTLVEMMVVIAIFTIITTIALFDQARLNSNTMITNMAYEMALAIREAQVYGISVQADSSASGQGAGVFSGNFGVHFDISSPKEVIVYSNASDVSGTQPIYVAGKERVRYVFENYRGNYISDICVHPDLESVPGGVVPCKTGSTESVDTVNLVFKRPVPTPSLFASVVDAINDRSGQRAYIVISSPDRKSCRVVVVEPTGQVRIVDESAGLCDLVT
jgi:prepilin-type N-terminal cleavage/methylation domain-containing protein